MNRYIDADKLQGRIIASPLFSSFGEDGWFIKDFVIDLIGKQPAADVVEVRHGAWIKKKPDEEAMKEFHDMGLGKGMGVNSIYWTCSVCENWGTPNHKYCSSCGAKMKGE
jgi:hypothetical protein